MTHIYFAMLSSGAFVAGDSSTKITSYAYPTSIFADGAKKNPEKVAQEMLKEELRSLHIGDLGQSYDRGNWKLIHDATADHTTRGIIDSIMGELE